MNIAGISKPKILAALYNASHPQGMGHLHYTPEPMSIEEVAELLKEQTYFDYLKGRVMKIELSGDELETWLYNRDNGEGAAERVVEALNA